MPPTRISIVTPSYNQAQYLEGSIQSVLCQDYPAIEYIIADGGSSDGSLEIIRRYEGDLAHWFSEPDNGQADGINKGFRLASGEVLAWLNSDDMYLPGAVARVMKEFEADPGADVVFGDLIVIDSSGAFVDSWKLTDFNLRAYVYLDRGVLQPAAFWRREALESIGGLNTDLHFAMDLDLFMRMALRGLGFKHISEPLAAFRASGTNKSSLISAVGRQERRAILRELVGADPDSRAFRVVRQIELVRQALRFFRRGDTRYALRRSLAHGTRSCAKEWH